MFALILFLICLFVAVGTGLLAAWSDIKGMTIPNIYSGVVILSFFAAFIVLWLFDGHSHVFYGLLSHILGALLIFAITLVMFAMKGIGAADSKLATAFAFWVGLRGLPPFLFYMTVIGGLLGLSALAMRKWKPFKDPAKGSWVERVQAGESKVPYGVAIVAGALASFAHLGYFSTGVFASFF